MRTFLALLAVVALVLGAGCGDKSDPGTTAPKSGGDTPAKTMKDAGDAAKDAGDAMKDAAKSAKVTYTCGCGKEKTLEADLAAPS